MQTHVIKRLDIARGLAGIPFVITSGYRDKNHPESINNPTSSHIKGLAVDIASTPATQDTIIEALKKAGFLRIGIADNFIHADMDDDKPSRLTWFYDGRKTEMWA